MIGATLDRVIEIAEYCSGAKNLGANSAIDQDIRISGDDVTDFAEALAKEFGENIWTWPWQRFAQLDEGLSLLLPLMLTWQIVSWPFRGSFEYPSPYERLELGHVAAVIDKGHWFEP
jgi:hypothetical protein